MKRTALIVWALCAAGAASAQESDLSVSVGLRAWRTDWTTFSYYAPDGVNNEALTQISAKEKVAALPGISVRYGRFLATLGALASTRFTFDDGSTAKRSEWDASVGYSILPGLTATLGYKRVSQSDGTNVYRPAGPVLGLGASAPIGEGLSLYGSVGLGRLKTPAGDAIDFKANYTLTEVGLSYALNADHPRWTLTGGYRMQVLRSKEAFGQQDGRDTTQGFTLGMLVTF